MRVWIRSIVVVVAVVVASDEQGLTPGFEGF